MTSKFAAGASPTTIYPDWTSVDAAIEAGVKAANTSNPITIQAIRHSFPRVISPSVNILYTTYKKHIELILEKEIVDMIKSNKYLIED
jgi:hypothetical protein